MTTLIRCHFSLRLDKRRTPAPRPSPGDSRGGQNGSQLVTGSRKVHTLPSTGSLLGRLPVDATVSEGLHQDTSPSGVYKYGNMVTTYGELNLQMTEHYGAVLTRWLMFSDRKTFAGAGRKVSTTA